MVDRNQTSGRPQHILLLGGLSLSLINFRGVLIQSMLANGHRVTAVAGDYDPEVAATLSRWGADYIAIPLARSGMNPSADLHSLLVLVSLMRHKNPDVFLGYTAKPVVLGLLAARIAGVPLRYAMITGLGYAYTEGPELKRKLARVAATLLYRIGLRHAQLTMFQNSDDEQFFRHRILHAESKTAIVGGSGVDLSHYSKAPLPTGPAVFLMIARLLIDKGVVEFVQAARLVKNVHPEARFIIVGPLDPSPNAIPAVQVEQWVRAGIIEYKGFVSDVRPEIAACNVYVLPSYREGTPRTVLEAMAMGRPIITTDVPGCRETISPDFSNGILVPARSAKLLAEAAIRVLTLPEKTFQKMCDASLQFVRERFDVHKVTSDIMKAMGLD